MAVSPYMIAGGMNFGGVAPNDYQSAYANALSINSQLYNNILAGYQGLTAAQVAQQNSIQAGYGQLQGDVLHDIQNIDASQRQAIADTYHQQSGAAAQQLINRGLGNTTVQSGVQRGLVADKTKADIALSNQMAQLTAGYRSQLGQAGLNYQNQANMQNTALGSQQLGWMNSVSAPYPNVMDYNRAAMMRGAVSQGQHSPTGVGGIGGIGGGGFRVAGGSQGGMRGIGGGGGGGFSQGPSYGGFGGYGSLTTRQTGFGPEGANVTNTVNPYAQQTDYGDEQASYVGPEGQGGSDWADWEPMSGEDWNYGEPYKYATEQAPMPSDYDPAAWEE